MYCCTCIIQICSLFYFTHLVLARSTTFNYLVATTQNPPLAADDEDGVGEGRGMMDYDHEDIDTHDDHDDHHTDMMMMMKPMEEEKAVKTDPWANYYDFIINEGSFKFWAAFQIGTAILLIYSAFAAVYYAKFNVITTDYDYYGDFFARSNTGRSSSSSSNAWFGLGAETVQRILNAISSKKFS